MNRRDAVATIGNLAVTAVGLFCIYAGFEYHGNGAGGFVITIVGIVFMRTRIT